MTQPKSSSSFPTELLTLVSQHHKHGRSAPAMPSQKPSHFTWIQENHCRRKATNNSFGKHIVVLGYDALICLYQWGKGTLPGTGGGCRKVFEPLAMTQLVLQAKGKHAIHPSSPWLWLIRVAGFAFLTRHTHELNAKLRQEKRQAAAGADDHWSFPCEGVTFGNLGHMSCDRARK